VTGQPQPNLTWLLNGSPVDSGKIRVAESYTTLNLTRITAAEAGTYHVTAENSAGSDTTTITVDVIGKLDLQRHLLQLHICPPAARLNPWFNSG